MEQHPLSCPLSRPTTWPASCRWAPKAEFFQPVFSRRGSGGSFPVANKRKCELVIESQCFHSQVLSLMHQRSTDISWDGCSGWAPVYYTASDSHLPNGFSFVWIFLFNILFSPWRLLQIPWWFRFTSLLLKINICIVMTWTVILRRLIAFCRYRRKCKSLLLKLPVQSVLSQRFSESLYLYCKSKKKWKIKQNTRYKICLERMALKPLGNWE